MKEIPGYSAFFVKDLFIRAASTLKKCAKDDFKNLSLFKVRDLRKVMEDSPLLDPFNLFFFKDQILQLGYIAESDLPVTLKALFDLLMSYMMVFK